MTATTLHLGGERLLLDPAGAAFWPAQSLLAVADLHFEKGSAAAARGQLVPPYDTAATLDLLARLLRRYRPKHVVALGDSFHDAKGSARLMPSDATRLAMLTRQTKFTWVLGNHDPAQQDAMEGDVVQELALAPFTFRHEATGRASHDISGHFHPKATVPVTGTAVTRPCFVSDGTRLLLPALGAYTGGLDVQSPAIARLFPRGGRIFLLGRERLFTFPLAASGRARAALRVSSAD